MSAFSVLVDARGTQEGFKQHRQRGLGHYAVNLLERLPHMPTRGTLNYLIESGKPIEEFISGSGVRLTSIRPPRARSFPGQTFAYQRILPAPMRKSACDFAHFLFHLDAPLYSPIPTIVTIPDLIPHRMKESYSWERRVKNSVQFRLERGIAHRAEAIIAISEYTRRDIVDHLQVDPGKVSVVYLGVHERFFQRLDPEALARVRSLYHLPDRFILYLGGIDPRKNVPSLVDAWGELWNDSRFRIPLVLAGKLANQKEYPDLLDRTRRLGLQDQLLMPGYVPENDLPALFAAASAFAFPSLYEGFGLPVLQAMAAGCPVLAIRTSSIPEIAGDAAWYAADPTPGKLATGLRTLLENPEKAVELTRDGRARAASFSWDRTAQDTLRVYEAVAERLKRSHQ